MRRNNREKPRSIPPEPAAASTIDLVALQLLTENDAPIGNNRLVQALEEAGIAVAEATAGRALSKLVSQGLARTLGKRGRVVTPAGREKLASLQREMMRRQRSARLVDVANIGNVESLRDMLIVRRAIEPEAARLAASRPVNTRLVRIRARNIPGSGRGGTSERRKDDSSPSEQG